MNRAIPPAKPPSRAISELLPRARPISRRLRSKTAQKCARTFNRSTAPKRSGLTPVGQVRSPGGSGFRPQLVSQTPPGGQVKARNAL